MTTWKQENRVILPKPGKEDYSVCNAYRTVLITSCLGKRFEFITAQRLMAFLDSTSFDMDQFAYLKRSTTQALLTVTEKVKKGLLNANKAGVLFFDFFDAFGSVNRSRLLVKIGRDFGISGRLFLHIQSFLTNRFARLKIDNCFGDWIESIIGTTGGTRLGPLLFIMYLHYVPRSISSK